MSVLQEFRNGGANVLLATSIGEEGLDIPSADLVIFYEPVSSEIRTIQRRGRTGRQRLGEVIVLIAEGTRDEGAKAMAVRRGRICRELYIEYGEVSLEYITQTYRIWVGFQ